MLRVPWRCPYQIHSRVQSYFRHFLAIRLFVWLQSQTHPEGLRPTPLHQSAKQSSATSPLEGASTNTASQSTDVRRNLMRGAQSAPSTTPAVDLAPLKALISDLVQHEAYRGLPQEKRTELMEQQLGKL